jgi:hypothetical protein
MIELSAKLGGFERKSKKLRRQATKSTSDIRRGSLRYARYLLGCRARYHQIALGLAKGRAYAEIERKNTKAGPPNPQVILEILLSHCPYHRSGSRFTRWDLETVEKALKNSEA